MKKENNHEQNIYNSIPCRQNASKYFRTSTFCKLLTVMYAKKGKGLASFSVF